MYILYIDFEKGGGVEPESRLVGAILQFTKLGQKIPTCLTVSVTVLLHNIDAHNVNITGVYIT
jgi:hypothetical protein